MNDRCSFHKANDKSVIRHLTFIQPLLDNTAVAEIYPQSVFGMLSATTEKGA